jgi:hypothetical protein
VAGRSKRNPKIERKELKVFLKFPAQQLIRETYLRTSPAYLHPRHASGIEDFQKKSSGPVDISKSNPYILGSLDKAYL